MELDTYESTVLPGYYVTVTSGVDPRALELPSRQELSHLTKVRERYEFPKNVEMSAMGRSIHTDIKRDGFALHSFDLLLYQPPPKQNAPAKVGYRRAAAKPATFPAKATASHAMTASAKPRKPAEAALYEAACRLNKALARASPCCRCELTERKSRG